MSQVKILTELHQLNTLIYRLMGGANPENKEPFSIEALDKAAKEFEKMSIERGEWVDSDKISEIIRSAPWDCGNFIREEFKFVNFFKKGRTFYYYKNDLIALRDELKKRNINLERYIELKRNQEDFEQRVALLFNGDQQKSKKKPFKIPARLKEIETSPAKKPDVKVVRAHLKELKKECFDNNIEEYIDIYYGNYAMMKNMYYFEKYLEPEVRKRVKRWVNDFNYVNTTLKMISKKKEEFIPVKEEDQIEL